MDYYTQYSLALAGDRNPRDYLTPSGEDRYYQAHDLAAWDRYATPLRRAASDFARRFRFNFGLVEADAK